MADLSDIHERMIRESLAEILEQAEDRGPDEVILILDLRDDAGADLAAQLDMPAGALPAAAAEASYREARAAVEHRAQALVDKGLEPLQIATCSRAAVVRGLHACDLSPLADELDTDEERVLVVVAAEGASLAGLPSGGAA